jgi:hypothetical protein
MRKGQKAVSRLPFAGCLAIQTACVQRTLGRRLQIDATYSSKEERMLHGKCHCGAVSWTFSDTPESATACNCTVCRRYAALWAYDYEGEGIKVDGPTSEYTWKTKSIGFHFCPTCGCVAYWRGVRPDSEGRRRIAVNLRLAEPADVAAIPVDRFDGLTTWTDLHDDGRRVNDYWG